MAVVAVHKVKQGEWQRTVDGTGGVMSPNIPPTKRECPFLTIRGEAAPVWRLAACKIVVVSWPSFPG